MTYAIGKILGYYCCDVKSKTLSSSSVYIYTGSVLPILLMHQSFVTTTHPPTGNSRDNMFSSMKALLKKPCTAGISAESHSPALYNSKFHWGIFVHYHKPDTYLALRGALKRSLPHTLALLSPAR